MYVELSSELAKHGIEKSREQCKGEVTILCQEYHNETGRGRINWKYNDMLNELLGRRPPRPPSVLDTADDTLVVGERSDEQSDGCDDRVERDESLGNTEDDSTGVVAAVEISSEPSSSSRSATPVSSSGIKG